MRGFMAKNKLILITGGAGFIGSSLLEYLLKKYPKYNFISIDRKQCLINNRRLFKYMQDINDDLPNISGIDTVIHLAALPSVRDSDLRTSDVINDNILATQKIINQCINVWKSKRLIITSSSSVYDGRENKGQYECFNLRPLSPYASSKLACEGMVKMYINNGKLRDIKTTIIRPFTVYGPNQRDELSIRAIINACLKGEIFTLYGDGTQRRDFTYIDDVCSAIDVIIHSDNLKHLIYNIGTGGNISINEVISEVCTILNKPITIKYEPTTIYDCKFTKADMSTLKTDTGWESKTCFDIGLRNQILWQQRNL